MNELGYRSASECLASLRNGEVSSLELVDSCIARIEALIRRATGHSSPIMQCHCGKVVMDTTSARVTMEGNLVELTALEYRTLEYLMQHAGEVVSKTELTEHIYDQDFDRDSNVIEVLINRLRGKLCPEMIKTRRGLGYQLAGPTANA